jgi:hypothetical protein
VEAWELARAARFHIDAGSGYEVIQVDTLLDRIAALLDPTASVPPDREQMVALLRDAPLRLARQFGYRMLEVDELMERLMRLVSKQPA